MHKPAALAVLVLLLSAPLHAEETMEEAPPPPPMPPSVADADVKEDMQPEVTIIRRKQSVIEEYRVAGRLYMIKITPSKGLPYYLIDSDGDGSLETRRNELDNPEVVKWRLFTW